MYRIYLDNARPHVVAGRQCGSTAAAAVVVAQQTVVVYRGTCMIGSTSTGIVLVLILLYSQ